MLEFEPEIESSLQSRYPKALEVVYDHDNVDDVLENRPGTKREHVFDFFDGCRMIVSRESMEGCPAVLHFSMSLKEGYSSQPENEMAAVSLAVSHAVELMGEPFEGRVSAVIDKEGIVHLIYDKNQLKPPANPMWN